MLDDFLVSGEEHASQVLEGIRAVVGVDQAVCVESATLTKDGAAGDPTLLGEVGL